MTTINFTKQCQEQGITTFSRTRGGWMKLVEGYDNTEYGGYRFIGSKFIKVGNYDTEIPNGLYLDCSKHFDKENEKVNEIINLFSITDGEITLLNTIPKSTDKWANTLESDVKTYFSTESVTSVDILNTIHEMTCNKEILHEVAMELSKNNRNGKVWLNKSHFGAFMQHACVYNGNYYLKTEEVQKKAVELYQNDYEADGYFNYEIIKDHEYRLLYSFIKEYSSMKFYKDYKLVFERISEDYYLNTDNLDKLRQFNTNETFRHGATHDLGYWFSFGGTYSNTKRIYILVPNMSTEEILVQTFELHL